RIRRCPGPARRAGSGGRWPRLWAQAASWQAYPDGRTEPARLPGPARRGRVGSGPVLTAADSTPPASSARHPEPVIGDAATLAHAEKRTLNERMIMRSSDVYSPAVHTTIQPGHGMNKDCQRITLIPKH